MKPNDLNLSDGAKKPSETETAQRAVRCSALLGESGLIGVGLA